MKKIIVILLAVLFLITGCNTNLNTPTKRVEEFFSKYQMLDATILSRLDKIVSNDLTLDDEEKEEYKELMKKQYQNLSYKITDEKVEKESAKVYVEIEVYDYKNAIDKSEEYFENNKKEFLGENNKVDDKKYMDYRIKEMQRVNDKRKYEIVFNLNKINDSVWVLDDIEESDIEKIHGIY